MKCRSVACIWSDSVPSHRVTATAVLADPPTLFTGGSDGSIVLWTLSRPDSEPEFKPTAMLCGHAATISELDICNPVVSPSNSTVNSSSGNYGNALFSVCKDGVMCVWSRNSGHCRRRRKLPPWLGTPSMARTLRSSSRYVCVTCCFVDSVHESVESGDGSGVRESQRGRGQKCSVVIVDTYTLSVVQTVFHGNLSIGSLKLMALVSSARETEKHLVVLSDSYGRVQTLLVTENLHDEREGGSGLPKSSAELEMAIWEDGLSSDRQVVAMATCRNVIAFVLESCCEFRLVETGATIGKISFMDTILCENFDSVRLHASGCMFLEKEITSSNICTEESPENHEKKFAVWNDRGGLLMYSIIHSEDGFSCELLSKIPVDSCPRDLRFTTFTRLNSLILCVESLCIMDEEPLHWKPVVTIYSQPKKYNGAVDLLMTLRKLGRGSSFIDWTKSTNPTHEIEDSSGIETELSRRQCAGASTSKKFQIGDDANQNVVNRKVVSSSMVIAETSFAPYAVVYGFFSGEIEVIRFDFLEGQASQGKSSHHKLNSPLSRQTFLGHTNAVQCLAAHHMVGSAKGLNFRKVLVSGSKDCTVRIWDLDTGNVITVFHHHVAPVRQIILPPSRAELPWSDCFLSVGDDYCVTLVSFETLRVERMFAGHPNYTAKVVWDGVRGYIACLCPNHSGSSDANDTLYLWDVKTGARERVLRGTASHSMFDHFCKGISKNCHFNAILNENTSFSTLLLPIIEERSSSEARVNDLENLRPLSGVSANAFTSRAHGDIGYTGENTHFIGQSNKYGIKCSCPFPGIATLSFDLASLMFNNLKHDSLENGNTKPENHDKVTEQKTEILNHRSIIDNHDSDGDVTSNNINSTTRSPEECMIRFSLSFLHSWDVDPGLDHLLLSEMKLNRPEKFIVASGLLGDKGSLTLAFPDLSSLLEIWKSSSEFCAMRSLTMVSLAQRMISLSHSTSSASSALAAFYTRKFAENFPEIRPPLLQLLVSFWQDDSEHERMAARTLFHCAASRAIPPPLCGQKSIGHGEAGIQISSVQAEETPTDTSYVDKTEEVRQEEQSSILAWLESYEMQDWISCVGGTSQDAMTSHIIVAAALAVWYPSLVKPSLATLVVHPLMKLVMAMNDQYSPTAAELLAEGMESTWKACIGSEIPRLIGDIFFQVECVSGSSAKDVSQNSALPNSIRETLVGILLPSLAMADLQAFLTVIESQVWSTASDSPVHPVSLMTLIRVVRGSPKNAVQYLDKVVSFILQTRDPSNSVMRKTCDKTSSSALKEVAHAFPMVAINELGTRLAIGDVIGEIKSATIRVYDLQSAVKIKVLDASAPPGLPTLLAAASETVVVTAISALSFSPDGEGLVAFSEHGLMIRWWSLGSVWWEKLSRNLTPVQCTKLIFVPPWEGFSPTSSRSSIMGSVMEHDGHFNIQDNPKVKVSSHPDNLKLLIHNVDLSYRLQWAGERKIILSRHGHELGTYQL